MTIKSSDLEIKFDALFHYLPMKVPAILPFNPFQNNRQTLNHSLFENVYVLGNVFPTTSSFSAINNMSRIMAINIANKILGVRKQSIYKGESTSKIWIN